MADYSALLNPLIYLPVAASPDMGKMWIPSSESVVATVSFLFPIFVPIYR
jgi:hypothetical protein